MVERPVNLNKARKSRAKNAARARADANAVFHGLSKAQKAASRDAAARDAARHDQGRRERPEEE